jgi:hypothetical protein
VWNDLKNHWKGYVLTVFSEFVLIGYLQALRYISGSALVESGLNIGKVIVYPIRPDVFPWPHLVYTRGNIPMEFEYSSDNLRFTFLSLGRNPIALTLIASAPIAAYLVYRAAKCVRKELFPHSP